MKSHQNLVPISALLPPDDLIQHALKLLNERIIGSALTSPGQTKDYLCLKLAQKQHEVFCCIYLDNKNQIIAFEELFQGTIDQVSVYPREVVKRCLFYNASALIAAHNHPSHACEPSMADKQITQRLKDALALIDVRLLDHFIVGGSQALSLAERGHI